VQITKYLTASEFFDEMMEQDQYGKHADNLEERAEYWRKRIDYLTRRPANILESSPFVLITNYPIAQLRENHPIESVALVDAYATGTEQFPPIFVVLSDYMVSKGFTTPLIDNGHHRVAAAKQRGEVTIPAIIDHETWKNLAKV